MRHIRDCFSTKFNSLCSQASKLTAYNTTIQRYLPALLHPHCRIISFQNGCLVLGVPDSSWASQLRYLLPELRDQLRAQENWYQLTSVKIVIDTANHKQMILPQTQPKDPKKSSPWHNILQSLLGSVDK